MTTKKDTSLQSDFAKLKHEPDGSYKRIPSVFRSFIEKGGQFEAERGEYSTLFSLGRFLRLIKDRYHLYVSYACRTCYCPCAEARLHCLR
jgi:putative glutathione S-transferase